MKTSTILLTAFLIGFFASPTLAQPEPKFTLATNVEMENVDRLIFLPEGEMTFKFWDKSYIKVEIEISAPRLRRNQLKSLLPLGVFRLQTDVVGKVATMSMPNLEKEIKFDGKPFQPNLIIHLSMPIHMSLEQVQIRQDSVAGNM